MFLRVPYQRREENREEYENNTERKQQQTNFLGGMVLGKRTTVCSRPCTYVLWKCQADCGNKREDSFIVVAIMTTNNPVRHAIFDGMQFAHISQVTCRHFMRADVADDQNNSTLLSLFVLQCSHRLIPRSPHLFGISAEIIG